MAVQRTFSIIKPDATNRNLTGAINAVLASFSQQAVELPAEVGVVAEEEVAAVVQGQEAALGDAGGEA